MTGTDQTDVKAVVEAFGRAMRSMDFGALDALWDRDYEHFLYQPEEYELPFRTWKDFQGYLSYVPGVVVEIPEWRELGTDVAVLGDAAIAYYRVHIAFLFKDVDEPFAGDVRFTLGLRRTPAGWRLFHCHESRQLVLDDATES